MSTIKEAWSPLDIGGSDKKKDFMAGCHVGFSAGGFLRFPIPGDKKGCCWLDKNLILKYLEKEIEKAKAEGAREVMKILDSVSESGFKSDSVKVSLREKYDHNLEICGQPKMKEAQAYDFYRGIEYGVRHVKQLLATLREEKEESK